MHGGQREQRVRQWNMNEQPRVQNAIETRLMRQLALFFADAFQIFQRVAKFGRQAKTQLFENARCLRRITERRMAARGIFDKWTHAAKIKLAQEIASVFADLDADFHGRRGSVSAGRGTNRDSPVE